MLMGYPTCYSPGQAILTDDSAFKDATGLTRKADSIADEIGRHMLSTYSYIHAPSTAGHRFMHTPIHS
jgi:hypothetical protein